MKNKLQENEKIYIVTVFDIFNFLIVIQLTVKIIKEI